MIHVVALIVGAVVAVPMVLVNMGSGVDAAGVMTFGFGLGARIVPLRRSRRDMALIGARRVLPALFGVLRNSR
jgi:hypothetical protein